MKLIRSLVFRIIQYIGRLPPTQKAVARFIAYPLIAWSVFDTVNILARHYEWVRPASWLHIDRHGQNAVLLFPYKGTLSMNKLPPGKVGGAVINYRHKTMRVVYDIPEEFQHAGAKF